MNYSIGEFSKLAKVSVKTLRYYDEKELLKPAQVDTWNRYRYYSSDQLADLQFILSLREVGLSIGDISDILSGGDIQEMLRSRRETLIGDRIRADAMIVKIDKMLEETEMEYEVKEKEIPDYTVYYKQGVVKDFEAMSQFILNSGIECEAANSGIKCVEPDYCYVTYTDEEYRQNDIGMLYAQAVMERGNETDTIKFKKLDPVKAVCVEHRGRYGELGKAYAFIFAWMKEHSMEPVEAPRECYIDGCWNKDSEDDYLTEIQIPVRIL